MAGIDVNRGCHHRYTPEGIAIYMFLDEPGVFYNEHGTEVGAKAAQMAGFPVGELLEEREKQNAIITAGKIAAAKFKAAGREVYRTRGDYSIIQLTRDLFNVEYTKDGSVMNQQGPVPKSIAEDILDALQPEDTKKPA